jgi:uncharacterized protein
VVRLVRRPAAAPATAHVTEAEWNPSAVSLSPAHLIGADAVINLAGAGVGDHRWTKAYKQQLRDSRVLSTATLATALAGLDAPPRVLVNGSAIGYYGETGDTPTAEDAPPGSDFLATLCQDWESAASPARKNDIRVVHPRFGLVLSARGGAFGKLLPLARAGLGGRLGTGRQYWSYVSLHDAVRALRHIVDAPALEGPVNVTTPNPATNREITRVLGEAVHRPTPLAVPGFALRLAVGGFAEGILMSQRVIPRKLAESGFAFDHPTPTSAVVAALAP